MAHHIGIACIGLGNGIVWFINTNCNNIKNNLSKLSLDNNKYFNVTQNSKLMSKDDNDPANISKLTDITKLNINRHTSGIEYTSTLPISKDDNDPADTT